MSSASERRDLIVLVADRNMHAAVSGILERPKALRTRQLTFQILIHPQKDPGVLQRAHDFLRKPRSSAIYRALAESVSFRRCIDPAFQKLVTTLQTWFPPNEQAQDRDC